MSEKRVFEVLGAIDVSKMTEKKGKFTYLSWSLAWSEVCKHYNASRKIYKNDMGWNYHTDGKTAWVEVGVIIDGVEHIDMLPVMDMANRSIPLDKITSTDVNKAIQRSMVKALALHGLGLCVYAGEDLPLIQALIGDDRASVVDGYLDEVVSSFERQFGDISEKPEIDKGKIRGWLENADIQRVQRLVKTACHSMLNHKITHPEITNSIKKHLQTDTVDQCFDKALLESFLIHCGKKIETALEKVAKVESI